MFPVWPQHHKNITLCNKLPKDLLQVTEMTASMKNLSGRDQTIPDREVEMIRSVFYNKVRRSSSCGSCYPDPPELYCEPVLGYKGFPSAAQEVVKVKTAA